MPEAGTEVHMREKKISPSTKKKGAKSGSKDAEKKDVNFACSETRGKKIWLKNFFCVFELLSFFRGSFKTLLTFFCLLFVSMEFFG